MCTLLFTVAEEEDTTVRRVINVATNLRPQGAQTCLSDIIVMTRTMTNSNDDGR